MVRENEVCRAPNQTPPHEISGGVLT